MEDKKDPEADGSSDEGAEGLDKATEMSGTMTRAFKSKPDIGERPAGKSSVAADAPPRARSRSRSASPMAQCEPDPGPKRGPHVLRQSGRRLRDSDLVRIAREKGSGYDEIDFSRNDLTSKSVPDIVDICKKSQQLKILKLFNNRLGDDGAEELGEIFQHCASIEEIHLSHNDFTRKGVEILVLAADRGLPKDVKRPLWLRMEHNKVSDTEGFARDLERDCPAVCGREDRHRCTPRVCAKGRRIHLPFLIEAPKGRGRGKESWGPGQGQGPLRRERRDSRRRPCRAPMRRRSRPKESRSRSARRRPRSLTLSPSQRRRSSKRLRRSIRCARHKRRRSASRCRKASFTSSSSPSRPSPRGPKSDPSPSIVLPPSVTKLRVKAKPKPRGRGKPPVPLQGPGSAKGPALGKAKHASHARSRGGRAAMAGVQRASGANHARPPRDVRDDVAEYSYYSDYEYEYSYV